ncbi:FIST N-terminal domain-containing protein [Arenicella xantha]|uniref:Small ligand-binding sensory domain FIST n=1 Tax=Arenicella xantha TaxID=644221 RepID=A0A395JHP2_9GAMM|nr:FIST N-terminal domain-containing protein [Arenicella xantha]RBP49193.1 small ligand-binding sensory domain FIST [Arenicella xantha]
MSKPSIVSTGVSYGAFATDDHARKAVQQAIAKMPACTIGSVLLFLSNGYAFEPQEAIKQAAKAAGTPQVFGCCAVGLLTEDDWILDAEGAVAMVFPQAMGLSPLHLLQQQGVPPELVLTLATPNTATIAVNSSDIPQFGAVTTDEYGHGPYSVWQSGRIVEREFIQCGFNQQFNAELIVCPGVKLLSPVMQINRSEEHSVYEIDLQAASDNLLKYINDAEPNDYFGLLCLVSETSSASDITQGQYRLHHVISVDRDAQLVRLSGSARAGRHMAWATRDANAALQSVQTQLHASQQRQSKQPDFGLIFPNVGRGAEFFAGVDADLLEFKNAFPNTPAIGFYSNAEIAPGQQFAGLIRHYSTVMALFRTQ